MNGIARRQTRPARDGGRRQPQQHERRGGQRVPEWQLRGDERCDERDRHASSHLTVEAERIEARAERSLCGGDPLEQVAPRDAQPDEGAHDRVRHQPGLVREQRDQQRALAQREREIGAQRAQMTARRDTRALRRDHRKDGQQDGQHDGQSDEGGPDERGGKRQRPTGDQGDDAGNGRNTAAQVVDHLPAAVERNPPLGALETRARVPENPGQELPVATRPAVVSQRRDVVADGKLLDDLDVGREAGAREDALEEVVTENRVLGHAAGERQLERVDVVDALAGVGALAEQILIHIRDGGRIRIESARARERVLEERAFAPDGQRRSHAWLQDRVALDHALAGEVEARVIQGVSHLADQPARGVVGNARVRVERNDVADARGNFGRTGSARDERRVGGASEKPIQLVQLAALALPADPLALRLVPDTAPVEQQEALAVGHRPVALVQSRNAVARFTEQFVIVRHALALGVHPVAEQREAEVAVGARQVVDLEAFDLLGDAGARRQHRGHDQQRAQVGGNSVAQLQAGQHLGAQAIRGSAVHQRERRVRGGNETEKRERRERPRPEQRRREQQRQTENQRADDGDAGQIAAHSGRGVEAPDPAVQGGAEAERCAESTPAGADQVVAWIGEAQRRFARGLRGSEGCVRYIELRERRSARELLDRASIAIARWKVHLRELTFRAQHDVDGAHALEQLRPIDRRDQAHAGDRVAHRHVHRTQPLVLVAHDLLGRRPLCREVIVEPLQRGSDARILLAQPLHELHGERARERRVLVVAKHVRDRLGHAAVASQQAIRDAIRPQP